MLQGVSLQGGEEGGVVEVGRRRRDQLLHPLTLRQVHTCTHISWITAPPTPEAFWVNLTRWKEEALKHLRPSCFLLRGSLLALQKTAERLVPSRPEWEPGVGVGSKCVCVLALARRLMALG